MGGGGWGGGGGLGVGVARSRLAPCGERTVDDTHAAVEGALLRLQIEQRVEPRRVPGSGFGSGLGLGFGLGVGVGSVLVVEPRRIPRALECLGAVRTHSGDEAEPLPRHRVRVGVGVEVGLVRASAIPTCSHAHG